MDELLKLFQAEPKEPASRDETRTAEADPSDPKVLSAIAVIGRIWSLRDMYARQLATMEELEEVMLLQAQGVEGTSIKRTLPWDVKQHTRHRLRTILQDPPAIYQVPRDSQGKPADFTVGRAIRRWLQDIHAIHSGSVPDLYNAVELVDGTVVMLKCPCPRAPRRKKP